MSDRVTLRLRVHGRVQGVGFRYAMHQQASALGVTGWVRNRRDGTVEAMVQGTPQAVEAMRRWARDGPAGASVTGLDAEPAEGGFERFEMRETA
jgi:acylphosphatase